MKAPTGDVSVPLTERLTAAGLSEYLPIIRGGEAVHLNRIHYLRKLTSQGTDALCAGLKELGIADESALSKLVRVMQECLEEEAPFHSPKQAAEPARLESESWASGVRQAGKEEHLEAEPPDEVAPSQETIGTASESWPAGMKIVNDQLAISIHEQGMIREPNGYGYIHLAAEVERPHLLHASKKEKRELLESLKSAAAELRGDDRVRRADVFSATIIPPGTQEGRDLLASTGAQVHVAAFDVVVLVECSEPEAAAAVRETDAFGCLMDLLDAKASYIHCITATNAKRIDEVDKSTDGVFLFNYFYVLPPESGASPSDIMLGVWGYTAGWWTAKANLTNSTPLQPIDGENSEYTLINHARWDRVTDVLPALLFRPSLDHFVLRNFTVNGIVAMPVLYHLA